VVRAAGDYRRGRDAVTKTGVGLSVVVPLPSSPYQLAPQQRTEPPVRRAQVWLPPAEIAVAVVMPLTTTGVELSVVVPSPSSPYPVGSQQRRSRRPGGRRCGPPPAEIRGGSGDAAYCDGGGAVRRRPVAELAAAVGSPAADGAAGQEAQV